MEDVSSKTLSVKPTSIPSSSTRSRGPHTQPTPSVDDEDDDDDVDDDDDDVTRMMSPLKSLARSSFKSCPLLLVGRS